ncbi:MAG: hypothetical protein GVY32_10220 [Gammaproteobacteria bacterium]|jgi:hypothetical protein|nr:hypothetical protein [Gammaproteobacteria bacterium]
MRKTVLFFPALLLLAVSSIGAASPRTVFEQSGGAASADYDEVLAFYRALVDEYPGRACLREHGTTDAGEPLVVIYLSIDGCDPLPAKGGERLRLLVMNGIHPGEPAGVTASQLFARDVLAEPGRSGLDAVDIAIIAAYNIGGMRNRGHPTRANQDGPAAYGFRGNAQNYDLNRDFIKADSRNAMNFARLLHAVDPDLFIDTHTTNGADYQHRITLLATQADQLGGRLGAYWRDRFMPMLDDRMAEEGEAAVPYVNVFGDDPGEGWTQFLDTPRYSTGFAALFQVPGIVSETHMLKPFEQRVEAQRTFLLESLGLLAQRGEELRGHRLVDRQDWQTRDALPISWAVDEQADPAMVDFLGYVSEQVDSPFGEGEKRRVFDRSRPSRRSVPFRNRYKPVAMIGRPAAWVVPGGWFRVIERLEANQVRMIEIENPIEVEAEIGRIEEVESLDSPWEGHFHHRLVSVSQQPVTRVTLQPGDRMIPSGQPAVRYLAAVLSPTAPDSFFRWNFFDSILGRKEYFSSYLFEAHALEMLASDDDLRTEFEVKKEYEPDFAASRSAQLRWLYARSRFAEPAYRRYPVMRLPEWPEGLPERVSTAP